MNVFGRVAKGVFGKPQGKFRQLRTGTTCPLHVVVVRQHKPNHPPCCVAAYDDHEDDSEVESLLHQISDSRHAGDRRDAMSQLRDLLQDNPSVSTRPIV